MTVGTCQVILGLGCFFLILGGVLVLHNRREKGRYYDSLAYRRDLKEFLTGEPERSWLSAWKIGGMVSLLLGGLLAIAGGVLWLVLY